MSDAVAERDISPSTLIRHTIGTQAIDLNRMCCDAVLCTNRVDHVGDVLEPLGCDLSEHQRNATGLLHHGIGIGGPSSGGFVLPVVKFEDENGNYCVAITPEAVVGRAFFSQTNPVSASCWALVAEGLLKGWSVNGLPTEWERLPDMVAPDGGRRRCFRYTKWLLKEVSLTAVPTNPDCLTIALQKGMVGGHKLDGQVIRALKGFEIPGRVWQNGIGLSKLGAVVMEKAKNYEHEGRLVGETVGGVAGGAAGELIGPEGIPIGAAGGGYAGREAGGYVGSKIRKADEMDGMTEAHEHIRAARMKNVHHHVLADDDATAEAHREMDEHLAKAEEIAADTIESNGHPRPDGADFEQLKSMCKAGLRTAVGAGAGALVGNSLGGPVGAVAGGATGAYLANDDDDKHKAMTATEKRIVERRLARIERLNQPR